MYSYGQLVGENNKRIFNRWFCWGGRKNQNDLDKLWKAKLVGLQLHEAWYNIVKNLARAESSTVGIKLLSK